ncbi:UNVERIFIED_CONTAM: Phosphoinositide phosphatase SAC6 [Sesamum latifolium]|uniref:Phosphoinositide phosphatase SAC6 n=1 Tax=Sesamum latifolium TaxID=2727402 RepID=A0AAW2YDH7_9LAMI
MDKADPAQKLYNKMRLWEFPDQYVVEPTDGSSGSFLAISRLDGSMSHIGNFIHVSVFSDSVVYVLEVAGATCFTLRVNSFSGLLCTDEIPQCNSLRVPKIQTIYGVVGMLKLLAGKFCGFY